MDPSFFTINACNRCRKRKARCDTQIPACQPCQSSGSICKYTDGRSGDIHPRSYIHDLEAQLTSLESQIEHIKNLSVEASPVTSTLHSDTEAAQGCTPGGTNTHATFIPPSSGIHLVRSVIESAQKNPSNFESPSESADIRPSNNTKIALPSREIANNLLETFFSQYQVQYPILDQEEFTKDVSTFYDTHDGGINVSSSSPGDVGVRFMINMVLAISLMFMSGDHEESHTLSKSFTANAMADLSLIMQTKDVQSVQCLLLLLLLSILDSSPAPVWYISGLCMRMCIDLGCHSEKTIRISSLLHGDKITALQEEDTKRRLFWIAYGFDKTLNICLGRPFTFDDIPVDINLPGCSLKPFHRRRTLHWLELQRLQSEIAHKLHTTHDLINKPHETETEFDLSRWTEQMSQDLREWNKVAQTLADANGYNVNWWGYWYRTALLILYRPSPLRPDPSESDTLSCYTAAKELIQLSFLRISEGVAEFTWVDLNFQFMSGITIILIIWKSPIAREKAKDDWVSLKSSMFQWKLILERLGMRWERISRAREALSKLADVTMDLVEKDLTRTDGGTIQLQQLQDTGESRRFQRRSIVQQLHGLSQQRSNQTADQQDSTLTLLNTAPERNTGLLGDSNSSPQDQVQVIGNAQGPPTQSVGQSWTAFNTTTTSHEESSLSEIPSVNDATDKTWPLFDLSNITTIPDELNLWTYFSGPMLSAGDVVTANFNSSGRLDESLTNSILNFQGDLNSLTPDISLENMEESDYMQGYWAGQ
ncbi:purine utilization positive regulator [Fusarium heterosporum]|uniref:Purine utilization positive regulator n=1 Tax=Fusarium heterosporum TaxID=42747 RepID=A0A8H5TPC8_FUSHE|nr:purine utilization positive regulator [Fusarium heterosporum]